MKTNATTSCGEHALTIIAHELREPLASILLAAQVAGDADCSDDTRREMWRIVERQGQHLSRLVERELELGHGARARAALPKGWFDLGATITNAVEAVRPLLTLRGHQLTVALPSEPVFMLVDELHMQQVVINLLTNAAKYTEPGGQIGVSLESAGGLAMIEVRDNGVGIAPELLPRMFDLYRQGGRPTGGRPTGLGIGLALVKAFVEQHGGSVRASSAGPGAGSSFVVLLPPARPEAAGQPAAHFGLHGVLDPDLRWKSNARMDA